MSRAALLVLFVTAFASPAGAAERPASQGRTATPAARAAKARVGRMAGKLSDRFGPARYRVRTEKNVDGEVDRLMVDRVGDTRRGNVAMLQNSRGGTRITMTLQPDAPGEAIGGASGRVGAFSFEVDRTIGRRPTTAIARIGVRAGRWQLDRTYRLRDSELTTGFSLSRSPRE